MRSKMKSEPRVPGMRAGATVVKGRPSLRRVKRTLGVSSLSYLLACLPEGLCEAKWGVKDTLGSLPNTPSRSPLTFSLLLSFSASLCVLTSLPPMASFTRPPLPSDLAVPSTTAVPEGRISAPGGLSHPAAHPG